MPKKEVLFLSTFLKKASALKWMMLFWYSSEVSSILKTQSSLLGEKKDY